MTANEIRNQFLDFFREKKHTIVDSSPVVPFDDPTLMFTNAGMNQFKDVFLGSGSRSYTRVADTQKCIRAGGKHNDLDDVGQDTYHHTFFEMLGNWSFGDYFKKEAIAWAWELLTEVWGIEKDRLHATYFEGDKAEGLEPDTEAAELWRTVTDINPENIHPGNKKDNFWEMGETGPCGPCSEIHVDLTPDKSGASLVNAGDARVIELWNLVFIQFNRATDGNLSPLPAKHVDTGMGFERLVAVLTGKKSNYDTDVFTPIFDAIRKRTGAPAYTGRLPGGAPAEDTASHDQLMTDVSYRVIADHVRCLTFAITDGAKPSNVGGGYVLRRILRRSVRYGRQYMNMHEPFLCDLVAPLVEHMGDVFPELRTAHGGKNVAHVTEILRDEEASFLKTLDRGIKLFGEAADKAVKHHHGKIGGEDAFKLHDTYGFPVDLTQLMAEERGLTVNIEEYERLMEAAREQARGGTATTVEPVVMHMRIPPVTVSITAPASDDSPKYGGRTCDCRILGSFDETDNFTTASLTLRASGRLLLDRTCFYVEQGGQVGDKGKIVTDTGTFVVEFTSRHGDHVIHHGVIEEGTINCDQNGKCEVAVERIPTMKNHTSTHLLNWALREVLGDHVQQKGSLVDPEKTRFDFSHNKPVSDDELERIESLVTEQIDADYSVYTKEVLKVEAGKIKTLRQAFGENYPDVVRVVSIGANIDEMLADPDNEKWMKHSVEFCGGTHLQQTKAAGRFVLVAEEGVAKGIRRLVGVTGDAATKAEDLGTQLLAEADELLGKSNTPEPRALARADSPDSSTKQDVTLPEKLAALQRSFSEAQIPIRVRHQLREKIAELQKLAKAQEKQSAAASGDAVMSAVQELFEAAPTIADVKVVVGEVPGAKSDALRGAIDWVRNKTDSSAVLLATVTGDRVTMIAGMSKAAVAKGLKAGDLIKEIAPLVGGKGGGRPDMAQGGGSDASGIAKAVERASTWIGEQLG